jgi:type VI secretion system secreted protein Hcp
MPIYMQVEGVKGDSRAAGFMGSFELMSASLGTTRNVATNSGSGAVNGRPSVSEISVSTVVGPGAAILANMTATGKSAKMTISFVDNDGHTYLKVILEDALISSFQMGGSAGPRDQPILSMSLNFAKITYERMNVEQGKAVLQRSGFDLRTGKSF